MSGQTVPQGQHAVQHSRGIPAHASAQRDSILQLLREAKARGRGVKREELIFKYRYTQAGARIFELEQMGFVIEHAMEPGEHFVTYTLRSEPSGKAPGDPADWYEKRLGARPAASAGEPQLALFERNQ